MVDIVRAKLTGTWEGGGVGGKNIQNNFFDQVGPYQPPTLQYTCPGWWEMRRVRSTLSDSDNIAISVQVQLELDLPTGTELGNNRMNTK